MEELTQDGAQLARTMLMAAAQLAESMARVQAQRAWVAQSRSTAQAAQAQQQIAAERDAARPIFRPLTDDRYWQAPSLDRVVKAYMTASSWAEHDPEALAALQLIRQYAETCWAGDATTRMDAQQLEAQAARLNSAPGVGQPIGESLRISHSAGRQGQRNIRTAAPVAEMPLV